MPARKTLQDVLEKGNYQIADSGCWEWQKGLDAYGYGQIQISGKKWKAHRASWVVTYGETDLHVCHRCDNRKCINPDHLFVGTPADNLADMRRKGRGNRGSRNGGAVLTEEDVRRILVDGRSQKAIARDYGISPSVISNIKRRVRWTHVRVLTELGY